MKTKHYKFMDMPEINALDGVKIREIISAENSGQKKVSLATGAIEPGHNAGTHYHKETEEIYFIVSGQGKARIGDETFSVNKGDAIYVPIGVRHGLINDKEEFLEAIAISLPAYSESDFLL